MTQGGGGLAEARRRDEQARGRIEAGLIEVSAALQPFRSRFFERESVRQVEQACVTSPTVLGVRGERLRLGEQVGFGGAG